MNTMTRRRANVKFPTAQNYMYFEAIDATTYTFTKDYGGATGNLYYSTNKANWTQFSSGTATASFAAGSKVYIKGNINRSTANGPGKFSSTGKFNVGGNLMSIFDFGELKTYACVSLFEGCSIVDASNLELPATTLKEHCYEYMFRDCEYLTAAPTLPATTLAKYCYSMMFDGTSITVAPELPATTLEQGCYFSMFQSCTALTTPPLLPAPVLAPICYLSMFYGCTSLTHLVCLATDISATNCVYNILANIRTTGYFYKSPDISASTWESTQETPTRWQIRDYTE